MKLTCSQKFKPEDSCRPYVKIDGNSFTRVEPNGFLREFHYGLLGEFTRSGRPVVNGWPTEKS